MGTSPRSPRRWGSTTRRWGTGCEQPAKKRLVGRGRTVFDHLANLVNATGTADTVRPVAAAALAASNLPAAADVLAGRDPTLRGRRTVEPEPWAFSLLVQMGNIAVPALAALARSERGPTIPWFLPNTARTRAVDALTAIGTPRAIRTLVELLWPDLDWPDLQWQIRAWGRAELTPQLQRLYLGHLDDALARSIWWLRNTQDQGPTDRLDIEDHQAGEPRIVIGGDVLSSIGLTLDVPAPGADLAAESLWRALQSAGNTSIGEAIAPEARFDMSGAADSVAVARRAAAGLAQLVQAPATEDAIAQTGILGWNGNNERFTDWVWQPFTGPRPDHEAKTLTRTMGRCRELLGHLTDDDLVAIQRPLDPRLVTAIVFYHPDSRPRANSVEIITSPTKHELKVWSDTDVPHVQVADRVSTDDLPSIEDVMDTLMQAVNVDPRLVHHARAAPSSRNAALMAHVSAHGYDLPTAPSERDQPERYTRARIWPTWPTKRLWQAGVYSEAGTTRRRASYYRLTVAVALLVAVVAAIEAAGRLGTATGWEIPGLMLLLVLLGCGGIQVLSELRTANWKWFESAWEQAGRSALLSPRHLRRARASQHRRATSRSAWRTGVAFVAAGFTPAWVIGLLTMVRGEGLTGIATALAVLVATIGPALVERFGKGRADDEYLMASLRVYLGLDEGSPISSRARSPAASRQPSTAPSP